MEEVDQILLPILKEIGCVFPSGVTSISQFDSDLLYHATSLSINTIQSQSSSSSSQQSFPTTLPAGKAPRFRICSTIANVIKDLGYTGELGYDFFLYPNETDMRKFLIWLIEKLPKHEEQTQQDSLGSTAMAARDVHEALRTFTQQTWNPLLSKQQHISRTWQTTRLTIPIKTNDTSKETLAFYNSTSHYPVSAQPLHATSLPASLFEQNTTAVIHAHEAEGAWQQQDGKTAAERAAALQRLIAGAFRGALHSRKRGYSLTNSGGLAGEAYGAYGDGSSAFARRTAFEQERDASSAQIVSEHGTIVSLGETGLNEDEQAEKLRVQRENELAELNALLNDLQNQKKLLDSKAEQLAAAARLLEGDITRAESSTGELEAIYKVKKRTLDLLPEADKNLVELAKLCELSSQRLVDLGVEWEKHRIPLVTKYRRQKQRLQERKDEVGMKVDQIKRMRIEMKEKAQDLRDKEKLYQSLVEEFNALPKSINRQVYVRRIMDIVKNLERQKEDIKKILIDVHRVQKEINSISETSKRSFGIADEMIYQQAKKNPKDEATTKAYKYLVHLRQGFVDLVKSVEDTGKTANEIRDITSSVHAIESRNTQLNFDRINTDLAQVKKENKQLATKLKAHHAQQEE